MATQQEAKRRLRSRLRARPDGLSPAQRERKSQELAEVLSRDEDWARARDVAAFVGWRAEPDTKPVLQRTLAAGKRLWLPRIVSRDPPTLQWVYTTGLDALQPGTFGIPQPPEAADDSGGQIGAFDLVLVPGLAFGRDGARIGAGHGYYDRALETVRALSTPVRMGICFEAFLDPPEGPIAVQGHDIRMHAICTECGVLQCR